ncbi:hypothetical protein FRB99_004364 [Tulasnella sp. 403]|nr:hypothetical protein FRB99_004364 [Tulasnella sp. 403]
MLSGGSSLTVRSKVAALRTTVSTRQSNLRQAATILSPHLETQTRSQIHTAQARTVSTENALIATRKVLIRSLVEAFDLREAVAPSVTSPGTSSFTDGYLGLPFAQTQRLSSSASYIAGAGMALFGRSGLSGLSQSITGDSGRRPLPVSKGEWSIAGLVLPVPGDLRRYPPDYVTAAVVHTLHFVRLLTFYLGVKLPFEVTWSGGMPGVGQPTIAAGSGTDRGGWATWTTPYPLYLTSDTPSSDSTGSSSQSSSQRTKPSIDSFTTALCMLNYNIAYLSHTQGLDIPLSLTGETLRNLWTICCITTETFARASHSTPSQSHKLPPPTLSPNFTLDFGQLLQIASPRTASNTSSGTTSRSKHRRTSKSGRGHVSDITDEWNLVEIDEGEEDVDEQEQ